LKKAATLTETLLVIFLTMSVSMFLIEAGLRVYESFAHMKKEHYLYDKDASHPSGNSLYQGR
jgi:hypothetical protein|tara:strand:- start:1294 stop:1479 length:186 start_codon:yes stop_codon:yes gene_type:complete